MSSQVLNAYEDEDLRPLWEPVPVLRRSCSKEVLPYVEVEFMCFSLCLLPLALSLGTTEKSLAPLSLPPPTRNAKSGKAKQSRFSSCSCVPPYLAGGEGRPC